MCYELARGFTSLPAARMYRGGPRESIPSASTAIGILCRNTRRSTKRAWATLTPKGTKSAEGGDDIFESETHTFDSPFVHQNKSPQGSTVVATSLQFRV